MEKRNFVIVALCVAIGIMAVAYAAFSTTLNINGTIEATGTFAVTFQGNGTCTGTPKGKEEPTGTFTSAKDTTSAVLSVSLYTPGDVVVCSIPVKNTGNLDAINMLNEVSDGLTSTSSPISVKVEPENGPMLPASQEKNMIATITYNWQEETQPDTTLKTFTVTSSFAQNIN